MLVSHILREKGRDIVAISPESTLYDAANVLTRNRIGALLVQDGRGALAGILSERDIVRAIARDGATALEAPVSRYMTIHVVATNPLESVERLMQQMTEHRFRHMPVMEDGRLAGLVSIGDVVKWHVEEIDHEREAMRDYIAHT